MKAHDKITKEQEELMIWTMICLTFRCNCIKGNCKACITKENLEKLYKECFGVSFK